MKIFPLIVAGLIIAAPALAQSTEGPDNQRLYENSQPIVLQSDGDMDATAQTDPLGQVDEVALRLRFDCSETGCRDAGFRLAMEGDSGNAADMRFAVTEGILTAMTGDQAVAMPLHPGDTFDVRIRWTNGHRVSFDLYANDPLSGAARMESHDVQLDSRIRNLAMSSSHGRLTIVSQVYSFR